MRNIVKRPYREMCDFYKVYNFMVKNFTPDCRNGCYPPFFEYSLATPWSDNSQNHRFAIWEEDNEVVAFCWYESNIGEAFFNLTEKYSFLIPEMIDHAECRLSDDKGKIKLKIYAGQQTVLKEALDRGYQISRREEQGILDFNETKLDAPLPEGYLFEPVEDCDAEKLVYMTWRGFDNEGEPVSNVESDLHTEAAPNATPELDVIIKTEDGEYVCYAGMWWVPENKLAYLEPLCTVPEHRGKGLARAALSELYRKTSQLGAAYMSGGTNEFYYKIGYKKGYDLLYLEKI